MAHNKLYRSFIILQENEKGHSIAQDKPLSGYAKIEAKNEKCKIAFYVQNLKKDFSQCYMILICNKKDGKCNVNIGPVNINSQGKAEMSMEYDGDNIGDYGISYDKVIGAALYKDVSGKTIYLMCGFLNGEQPKDNWKSYKMIDGKKMQDKKSESHSGKKKEFISDKKSEVYSDKKKEFTSIKKSEDKDSKKSHDKKYEYNKESKHKHDDYDDKYDHHKKHHHDDDCDDHHHDCDDHHHDYDDHHHDCDDHHHDCDDHHHDYDDHHHDCDDNHYDCDDHHDNWDDRDKHNHDDYDKKQSHDKNYDNLYNDKDYHSKKENNFLENKFDDYEKEIEIAKNNEDNIDIDDFELRGSMGDFFSSIVSEFEPIKGFGKDIKNCKWYKVKIDNFDEMCNISNYNKYTVIYYPMINYFPYISKRGHFYVGLKCDKNGVVKYIVYAIPGTKDRRDQPYGGRTGFVTWVPDNPGDKEGNWLMFYDFQNSMVVVPMK